MTWLCFGPPASIPTNPPTSPPAYPPAAPPPTCQPTTPTLLSKLTHATTLLPECTPLANAGDAVASLCGDPEAILFCLEDDEPYVWLDHKLNNICSSWAINQGLVPLAMKCGDLGLLGLCCTLQYFIDHELASETLLET